MARQTIAPQGQSPFGRYGSAPKPLVPPRGLFALGKFDQYKRDIPYSTLVQAFQSLVRPLAEWADGDSVAAHYAYGIDIFCSEDFGKSLSNPSVLDAANRVWLTKTFGIQFATLGELAQMASS